MGSALLVRGRGGFSNMTRSARGRGIRESFRGLVWGELIGEEWRRGEKKRDMRQRR